MELVVVVLIDVDLFVLRVVMVLARCCRTLSKIIIVVFINMCVHISYTLYRSGQNLMTQVVKCKKSVFLGAFRFFFKTFFDTRLRLFT